MALCPRKPKGDFLSVITLDIMNMKPDIIFCQQYPMIYFGVLPLLAHMKKAGYQADILIDTMENNLTERLCELNPPLVGFSVFSTEHTWLVTMVAKVRKVLPKTKIVVGGIHAMIYPEKIIEDSGVDFVCHCDGEQVIVQLLQEITRTSPDWQRVHGIIYRDSTGAIHDNGRTPLVPFNDDLIEDRDVYLRRYPDLRRDPICFFMSSRGCPYSCTFCYNSYLRNVLGSKGFLRRKKPETFLREIEFNIAKYNDARNVFFVDDLFTLDKDWLRAFLPGYRRQVGLPFACTTRADLLDEQTADMLAAAGCISTSFGLETGNEDIRKRILNKQVSDEEIVRCGRILKQHGISVRTSSMFGLPEETVEDALKTVTLNIRCGTDMAASTLLLPYPETEIARYCKEHGYLSENYSLKDLPQIQYLRSVMNLPDQQKIINVHYLLYFLVRYPWTYRLGSQAIRLTMLSPLYHLIFLIGYVIRNMNENRLSWLDALVYGWRKRKLLRSSIRVRRRPINN